MSSHILFPQIEPSGVPATMSRRIMHDILRGGLGFDGLVLSDCMVMDAIRLHYGTANGVVAAMKAGVDMVFVCSNPALQRESAEAAVAAAERGEIDPLTITADQYDLVCNGVELSSGAVRNHDPEIMIKAFELVRLGEEDVKKKFPAMYNAFCYGAPPHAGIAPGVDRMVMLLSGEESIREVIAFPMNKNAQDVMMGAPSTVEQKQLDELHIALVGETEE